MRKFSIQLAILGIVQISFLCLGCDSTTEVQNEYSISIVTQNGSYSRTSSETVKIELNNTSSNQFYLPIDSTFTLERKEGNSWTTDVWSIQRIGVYKSYSLYPNIPHSEEMAPGFLPSKGTYRFRFKIYNDNSLTELLPENVLYSNTFEATE